jgi:hypothetical protein
MSEATSAAIRRLASMASSSQEEGSRAAAEPFEDALRGQVVQIASDGHLRGARQVREFGDCGRSCLLDGLDDQSVTFHGAHTVIQHHPFRT